MNSGVPEMIGTDGRSIRERIARLVALGLCAGMVYSCGYGEQDYLEPSNSERDPPRYTSEGPAQSVFGPDGGNLLDIFGSDKKGGGGGGEGIGVNSFLWRATLDTVSFMPLTSADPFGGVIITDWYTPPEVPKERFKINVFILGRQLRADGLRVAVFRQAQAGDGKWADASVKSETSINLENQILTRARQLRVAAASTN